jgi:hypothetical protein
VGNIIPLDANFFHTEQNPKYKDVKQTLMKHNVISFKHPRDNKKLFCWKGAGKLFTCWIDIPHGAQLKMGDQVGWYLRLKEKLQMSGAMLPA